MLVRIKTKEQLLKEGYKEYPNAFVHEVGIIFKQNAGKITILKDTKLKLSYPYYSEKLQDAFNKEHFEIIDTKLAKILYSS